MTNFGWRSINWSGYIKYRSDPDYFSDIKATWTVPAIASNPADPSALVYIWIGIGGGQSLKGLPDASGIIQIGTGAGYDQSPPHNPIYFAWWETNSMSSDKGRTPIGSDYPVKPGDQIEASISQLIHVAFIKGGGWYIGISNLTQRWTFYDIVNYDLDQQTAEFIVETPKDINGKVYTLADFNQVTFDNCVVDMASDPKFTIADGGFMFDPISKNPISIPSAPNGHNKFTVAYGAIEPPAPN
ncbi:hypothetical protein AR454_16660 [Bacillus mycoides]|uniref:G1 family glutamic endopeptidase n=1 Tax=Bacillus mycoides TaxID=1405 RepID=UPI001E5CAD9A|nr:G1 family glutamic endopeptidase [Bacillus mycoides]MCD4643719.1 hypothetical protein [Bacillus mycoides]